jgi:hypothetical protein
VAEVSFADPGQGLHAAASSSGRRLMSLAVAITHEKGRAYEPLCPHRM